MVKVEVSLEGDFNAVHMYPSFPDYNQELRGFGRDVLGQPSVVYAVPITIDGTPQTATTDGAIGYGDWDGATGTLHPMDGTHQRRRPAAASAGSTTSPTPTAPGASRRSPTAARAAARRRRRRS